MRATAANRSLAQVSGIATDRVVDAAWLISGLLCGLAGVVLVLNTTAFQSTTGSKFLVVIIAAAMLGGVGRPTGAMLGALVLGLVTEISASFVSPSYKELLAFGVLVIVLLVRPTGILSPVRRGLAVRRRHERRLGRSTPRHCSSISGSTSWPFGGSISSTAWPAF